MENIGLTDKIGESVMDVFYLLLCVLCVFLTCIVVEAGRVLLFKPVNNSVCLEKLCQRIENRYKKIEQIIGCK